MPDRLGALYREAAAALRGAGLPTPELDARWLVAHAAGVETAAIVLRGTDPVPAAAALAARALVERRLRGEPVDRLLGWREFWGLPFRLAPSTLSPRPDTETVVEAALAAIPDRAAPLRVLDLGTGTGALLVALLHECRAARGVGLDRSEEAAATARANAEANGVGKRTGFLVGDWGAAFAGPFDLVVANPPYIEAAAVDALEREVREHDPRLALDGGRDGLDAYRAILSDAPRLLAPEGALVLELGQGQELAVVAIARAQGLVPAGPARPDLGGVPRALLLRAGSTG